MSSSIINFGNIDREIDYTFIVVTLSDEYSIEEILNKLPSWNGKRIQVIIIDRYNLIEQIDYNAKKIDGILITVDRNCSVAYCYELAKKYIKGKYVCFSNQGCIYDRNALRHVNRAAEVYGSSLILLNYQRGNKRTKNMHKKHISVKKIECEPLVSVFLPAFFIKKEIALKINFSEVCDEETGTMAVLSLYRDIGEVAHIENVYCYYSRKLSMNSKNYFGCRNKKFYLDSLKYNYLPFIKNFAKDSIPKWVQLNIYYQLYFKFYSNMNVRDKALLDNEEKKQFFVLTRQILQYIDDRIIIDNTEEEIFKPPFSIRYLFIYLKYGGDKAQIAPEFFMEDDFLYFKACDCKYDLNNHKKLTVKAFNIRNNELMVDLSFFTSMLYEQDNTAIYAKVNGIRHDVTPTGIYAHDKVFGVSIKKSYTFQLSIKLSDLFKNETRIEFILNLSGNEIVLPLVFSRAPSKLNEKCKSAYWRLDDRHIIRYKKEALLIQCADEQLLEKLETKYVNECIKWIHKTIQNKNESKEYVKDIKNIRRMYFEYKREDPKRRIWIYFDKLFKGGDNGEYQFRHDFMLNDGVERYYVINEDAIEAKRLIAEFDEHILFYGTRKCKLYGLLAENIIATHPDVIEFLGFDKRETAVFKDLFNANIICIAHGITIQKNADYQNRLFDNTIFYTTSSKYEMRHILKPIYGYEPDQVALTGMARFDGLKDCSKRKILITPTWRRNIVGGADRNSTRRYNPLFKETNYFKIYNRLINDKRIIATAQKTKYEIVFLLHPSMSAQADDYDQNKYVNIVAASGDMNYEKILTESSLMITDYSGIHYDFGYMRKPVIYYQPKEVPMRFEEGGMKFETMGFGPVCTEYEDAVRVICEYMMNDCKMPIEYKKMQMTFLHLMISIIVKEYIMQS